MAGKAALLKAPPEPPSEAAGAQVPAGVAAGKAGTGPLARPVRLTLGGLTAALESVVEEGKLGLTRPGMCGRKLLIRRCPILITTAACSATVSVHCLGPTQVAPRGTADGGRGPGRLAIPTWPDPGSPSGVCSSTSAVVADG
jgi:hypothetical protein